MEKDWKIDQLERVHAGSAIFRYIPEAIGSLLYCDTDQAKEEPLTAAEAKKKKLISIIIGVCGLALIWGFLYSHYIWASILSIVLLLCCWMYFDTSFDGADYFLGEKGWAIVSFSGTRDNITSESVYLFEELSYLFTGEVINKRNYSYTGTDYYFTFYKHPENDVYDVAFTISGSYNDKKPDDPMNPDGSDCIYQLMKAVERQWTLLFFNSHKDDDEINFAISDKENRLFSDAITIGHDYIDVGGTRYNHANTKKIYSSNGSLVIEHINHKTKWFGFKEEGDKHAIPLAQVGNRQAFLMLFESFYQI